MHLSKSPVPSDANLSTLVFADQQTGGVSQPDRRGSVPAETGFEQLFAGLAPAPLSSAAAAQTTSASSTTLHARDSRAFAADAGTTSQRSARELARGVDEILEAADAGERLDVAATDPAAAAMFAAGQPQVPMTELAAAWAQATQSSSVDLVTDDPAAADEAAAAAPSVSGAASTLVNPPLAGTAIGADRNEGSRVATLAASATQAEATSAAPSWTEVVARNGNLFRTDSPSAAPRDSVEPNEVLATRQAAGSHALHSSPLLNADANTAAASAQARSLPTLELEGSWRNVSGTATGAVARNPSVEFGVSSEVSDFGNGAPANNGSLSSGVDFSTRAADAGDREIASFSAFRLESTTLPGGAVMSATARPLETAVAASAKLAPAVALATPAAETPGVEPQVAAEDRIVPAGPHGMERTPASALPAVSQLAGATQADAAAVGAFTPTREAKFQSATSHREPLRVGRAIFAAPSAEAGTHATTAESEDDKTFVTTNGEALTPRDASVGIDAAERLPTMSARFATPALAPHPVSEYSAAVAPVQHQSAIAATSEAVPAATEPASGAQRAVEAVLHAVEQVSTRDQKTVNLQFSVGDAELAVRVELQNGEVRTTFRTDSPELRAALAQEWQAVASASGDRPARLAPAVFTSTDSAASSSQSSGDGSSRQREHTAQHAAADGSPAGFGSERARGARSVPVAPDSISSRSSRPMTASSHHLHAFA